MSLQSMVAAGFARLTTAVLALNTKVDSATPIETMVAPTAGDILIVKRGSAFYLALVDTLLGGGGGAALPVDVVAPAAGQEIYGVLDGVPKRIPIAQLINDAYPQPLGLWDHWTDWRAGSGNANASDIFTGTAVSSGTNTTALPTGGMAGYNDHGVFLRSSTTANGGYRYQTTSLVGMYFSGVARKYRCQFLWRTSFTGVTVRTGFHDTNTNADAVDGAYFEISGSTCSAKTANNSTRTTHATTITLSLDVAYTFDIEVNAAASEARFRVWAGNNYDAAVMDVTITTNIPSTSARTFGAGIVATEASTTAMDIGVLYSLGVGTPAGFARMYGVYSTPVVRPSAFADGNWSATPVAGGIELNIGPMPASGSAAVTALRYRLDGGAPVTLSGTGTGVRTLTLTPGQEYALQLQQVTAAGESDWSDTKRRTPLASGGGGGGTLAVVQSPAPVEQSWGTTAEQTMAAVGSGNSIVVVVHAPTAAGVPTISDSAGGAWGAPMRTYTEGATATYYWVRNNVTGGPTWVRATIAANNGFHIKAYEVSGSGAGLVEDAFGSGLQTGSDTWSMPFTSTVANVLLVAMLSVENGNTPTGTAPLTAVSATGGYQTWAHGIFPTAGSNTATVTLSAAWAGSRSWLALKGS
ncbi:hypothetical protein [Hydrogenophaga pseudoflava]|uniref:hypothetical protein n=1 Tax=Hydrogenophaga pseudoflava TaxID=47421 RepID=UPI0027E54E75|nr:hypothetical protein [Hydrogenophaga pseudoflava]MDQ7745468.1 hypothetical protein [Hydrogenophaga pseudoflava]